MGASDVLVTAARRAIEAAAAEPGGPWILYPVNLDDGSPVRRADVLDTFQVRVVPDLDAFPAMDEDLRAVSDGTMGLVAVSAWDVVHAPAMRRALAALVDAMSEAISMRRCIDFPGQFGTARRWRRAADEAEALLENLNPMKQEE